MAYFERYMLDESGQLKKVVINAGVGFCLPYYGETAPPGTLACDGSEISREAYKELFAVLGTKAGAGDGSTTFNLPDLRGMFVRGTGGNAAELGVEQGDAIRNITGKVFFRAAYNGGAGDKIMWNESIANSALVPEELVTTPSSGLMTTEYYPEYSVEQPLSFSAQNSVPTAAENRPVNVALLWCIIYE